MPPRPGGQARCADLGRGLPDPAGRALRSGGRRDPRGTGIEPELSTSGGTSDGRFLIELCPVVDFGLPNATMHKVGESAAVADIEALGRIYRRVLEKAFA